MAKGSVCSAAPDGASAAGQVSAASPMDLVGFDRRRLDVIVDLLDYVAEEPRSTAQVETMVRCSPALLAVVGGRICAMRPADFLDELERAGLLACSGKWGLARQGKAFLKGLQG